MQVASDADRLLGDLSNSITRQTGFDAVMRVRSSTGELSGVTDYNYVKFTVMLCGTSTVLCLYACARAETY